MEPMIDAFVVADNPFNPSLGWLHLKQLTEMTTVRINHFVGLPPHDKENYVSTIFYESVQNLPMLGKSCPCLAIISTRVEDIVSLSKLLIEKGATYICIDNPEKLSEDDIEAIECQMKDHEVKIFVGYPNFFSKCLHQVYQVDFDHTHAVTNMIFEHKLHPSEKLNSIGSILRQHTQDLAIWGRYWGVSPNNIVDVYLEPETNGIAPQGNNQESIELVFTVTTTMGRTFTLAVSSQVQNNYALGIQAGGIEKRQKFAEESTDSFQSNHLELKRELIKYIQTNSMDMSRPVPELKDAALALGLVDSLTPALLAQAQVNAGKQELQPTRKVLFTTDDVVCKTPTQQRIWYAPRLFAPDCRLLIDVLRPPRGRIILCVDDRVWSIYGEMMETWASTQAVELITIQVPNGEQSKTVETWLQTMGELWDANPLRHTEPIVAIGGGAVTDLVGFAASVWRRATPWVRIPTTLLGMVDASVGIKVSVNFMRKNGIGGFHSPRHTFIDPTFLRTNSERAIKAAVGEILKVGIIADKRLYQLIRAEGPRLIREKFSGAKGLPCETAKQVINQSIQGMLHCIGQDLYEENLSRAMDFGHTFSRWLERHEHFCLMHGEAVAIDSIFSVLIAETKGWLTQEQTDDILQTYQDLGLFVHVQGLTLDVYQEALQQISIHRSGALRAPLPHSLGRCRWTNCITQEELSNAWKRLEALISKYPAGVLRPSQIIDMFPQVGYRATDGVVVQPLDELPAPETKIRWGILGCGNIAHDFALVLKKVPNAVMTATAARDADRAQEFAQKYDIPRSYGSYTELVQDPDIDIVYVATIPELHREHVELALQADKHVLVEKPLATTPEDAAAIYAAAKASGKFCMEGMWMRFFPAVEFARRVVREGKIGKIQHVRSDFGFDLIADEGSENSKWECGAGMNAGVYPVHATVMILGTDISEVSAIGSLDPLGYGMDAEGTVYAKFVGNTSSVITWSHLVETAEEVDIIGTQGSIRIHSPAHAPTTVTITRKTGDRRADQKVSTTHEFPLPLIEGNFIYPNSEGLYYEAVAVQRCLAADLVQAPQASLVESVAVINLLHRAVKGIVGGNNQVENGSYQAYPSALSNSLS